MQSDGHVMIGWDVGGVNIKAVRCDCRLENVDILQTVVCPFEIWQDPGMLKIKLQDIGKKLGITGSPPMAVTITAELSDAFRNKREGVLYVLEAIEKAFENSTIYIFTINGDFLDMDNARKNPLLCAATNWLASARFINACHSNQIKPDCILMDIGSTTTDIIPIRNGNVVSKGNTDTSRLVSGELIYTGILRSNPNTLVRKVPVKGEVCSVAAEYFSSMADVYLILGSIIPSEYSCPTADGKEKTISAARDRLARLVCADSESMCNKEIYALASYIREKQIQIIVDALSQVLSRFPDGADMPLAVAGTGMFLAKEAARRLDICVIDLGIKWGQETLAAFPALSAAYLLSREAIEK